MQKYLPVIKSCPLFGGMSTEDIDSILSCLGAQVQAHMKNAEVLSAGDRARYVGLVLSGSVRVERVDYRGNRSVTARIMPGQLFAEAFACAQTENLPVSVCAAEETRVMFIDAQRIIHACANACGFHTQLIYNLMRILAMKNLTMQQKMEALTQRTTREKLMTYLTSCAGTGGAFEIPFDRQELADYLAVDRSGLSTEIGKLRREGVIRCEKNCFEILK